jgi:hypothetical protein
MPEPAPRQNFYRYLRESESLDTYVHEQMRARFDRRRTETLDERNIQSYRHGNRWTLETSLEGAAHMHSVVAESTIHTIDIINHETTMIESYMAGMVEQLYDSLMRNIFQTVSEAAESVGNIVKRDDHGGNIPAAFLAMLGKMEFGVDHYGRAQRPAAHVSSASGDEFIEALQNQPREFHLRVEMVSEAKEKQAIAREAERISRFSWQRR